MIVPIEHHDLPIEVKEQNRLTSWRNRLPPRIEPKLPSPITPLYVTVHTLEVREYLRTLDLMRIWNAEQKLVGMSCGMVHYQVDLWVMD